MTEDKLRNLLITRDDIVKEKQNIIEAFVKFYGEDRREEITQKFNNLLIISYFDINTIETKVEEIYDFFSKEFFGTDLLTKGIMDNIYNFAVDKNTEHNSYFNDRYVKYIDISVSTKKELLEKYNAGKCKKLSDFVTRYGELTKILEPFEKEIQRNKIEEETIKNKYRKQLIDEFKDLIPENELEREYFMSTLKTDNCVLPFDNEAEEILQNPDSLPFQKRWIEIDRISVLNACGFSQEIGTEYEDYLKMPGIKELIERLRKLSEKISKRRIELYILQKQEIIKSSDDYKKSETLFNKKKYTYNDLWIYYFSDRTCISPYFVKENGVINFSPIIFINKKYYNLDGALFHELNHAFEECVLSINDDNCVFMSGWEHITVSIMDEELMFTSRKKRTNELINEYINEIIAKEITNIYHNDGNTVFGIEEYKGPTYITFDFILNDFYNTFKEDILKSRSNGNIDYLYEKIGYDNFNELSSLVNEFFDNMGIGEKVDEEMIDAIGNIDNKNHNYIISVIERKNNLIEKMKNFNSQTIKKLS